VRRLRRLWVRLRCWLEADVGVIFGLLGSRVMVLENAGSSWRAGSDDGRRSEQAARIFG
jgi:hypothetical protein